MRRKLKIAPRVFLSKTRAGAGFTLTEVIMASALLIIAVVPILKALTSSQVGSRVIERRTRGLILAQAKLDEVRARSVYDYDSNYGGNNIPLGNSYLCKIADGASGTNLRTITVEVGYDLNGNGSLQPGEAKVALTTLVARRW